MCSASPIPSSKTTFSLTSLCRLRPAAARATMVAILRRILISILLLVHVSIGCQIEQAQHHGETKKREGPELDLGWMVKEASVARLQEEFASGRLTSARLVQFYVAEINRLNPLLHVVIELNPDAMKHAEEADKERKKLLTEKKKKLGGLHGIPILLKDNIATADRLNTTAGSFALLGSIVPRDAGVVSRLRKAGAVILGKANLSEWANFRSSNSSDGWSARGGQTKNPYVLSDTPSGSSSGSAVAVAANLVTVSLGSETDGSILAPASKNAVVGIKPTVGLTSRSGVIPISHFQDTVGPLCRTVADAVEVLEAIVGLDALDDATWDASQFIPANGYKQYLKVDGLRGKRIGVITELLTTISIDQEQAIRSHLHTMRKRGASVVENIIISNLTDIIQGTNEMAVLETEFKQFLNSYLRQLVRSPVRRLADVIQFNINHSQLEELERYDQAIFIASEATAGVDSQAYRHAIREQIRLTKNGIDKAMRAHRLDAVVAGSYSGITSLAAIARYPAISIPAGYDEKGVPFGMAFVAKSGQESTLIEIGYALEQATHIRKPPSFMR